MTAPIPPVPPGGPPAGIPNASLPTLGSTTADVIVVGAGLIGLACAVAAADRGHNVLLFVDTRRGEASPAAAGMLAPSVERASGAAHAFAVAARDMYPDYVAALHERTGVAVPLNTLGIIQVELDEASAERARADLPDGARWLDRAALAALEPALAHAAGAAFHARDGAVNNLVLMRALKHLVARHPRVRVTNDVAAELSFDATGYGAGISVRTERGERHATGQVVLAGGAWSPLLDGLPRSIPITPVRGQMLSVAGSPLRHVVYGPAGYVVPRGDGRTLIGATMEHVGFDADTTAEGIQRVRAAGAAICPPLGAARMLNAWAGLRPMSPDGLPIIGRDPERPGLVYACGHSRNGVLMAPLTGARVAALLAGTPDAAATAELAPFAPARFVA
jgi:glycine oxidase